MSSDLPTSATLPAGRIFISYRRNDSGYVAQVIRDRLVREFGTDAVFMDIDDIPLGVDFRDHVAQALSGCKIVLAVIGDLWAGAHEGAQRIDEPEDLVRVELEMALELGIAVIPVLVGHAVMPSAAALPESLQWLAYRNAAEVRPGKFLGLHLDDLTRGIATFPMPPPAAALAATGAVAKTAPVVLVIEGGKVELGAGADRMPSEVAPSRPKFYRHSLIVLLAAAMIGAIGYLGIIRGNNETRPTDPSSAESDTANLVSGGNRPASGSSSLKLDEFEKRRASARAIVLPMVKQMSDEGLNSGGVFNVSKSWKPGTVVKVCFMDGGPAEQRRVVRVASDWMLYANIGLDFGDWSDPRRCAKDDDPTDDVRVKFGRTGNWAAVGKDALTHGRDGNATLGLESAGEQQCSANAKLCQQAILHEFGHVLGFEDGWTLPQGNCQHEMNWDFIYQDALTNYGWSKTVVDQNLRPPSSSRQAGGDFDHRSVMNYQLPADWFKNGKESKCYTSPLGELSLRDKLAAMKFLP